MVETVYLDEATSPFDTAVTISAGDATGTNDGGVIQLLAGAGGPISGSGGAVTIYAGVGAINGDGGSVAIHGGDANGSVDSVGGRVELVGGVGASFDVGDQDGSPGGDIVLTPGAGGTPSGAGDAGVAGAVKISGLQNFADDAAAATGGVPVDGLYRTASAVKVRVS